MTATTLAILAGGAGSRMGGPKGALRVGGKPILAYLLDRLRWEGPTVLVTAPGRERPPGCEQFHREVTDPVAGEGPVRGVLRALEAMETDVAVVTTCDMPGMTSPQLLWLKDALSKHPGAPIVMLRRGADLEPFPFAVRRGALTILREHFDRGGRSMHSLAQLAGAAVLPAPDDWQPQTWTNLNTPADFAAFTNDHLA
ncbi:MAG: molybdenum cofactor guanylyltransferase [Tepidisphaeraceae bacterium]